MMMQERRPARKMPVKKPEVQVKTIWGAYLPDIDRSYPDLPVRGMIVDGKYGKEFRPGRGEPAPKHPRDMSLRLWVTGSNYDSVLQKMREYADEAIRNKKAEIERLDRFIRDN